MTAVPLSEAEAATLARFEAGQAAEESLRERVAVAIMDADYEQATGGLMSWSDLDRTEQVHFRSLADAAIATVRAPQRSVSAEQGAAGIPMTPERDETVTGL